MGDPWGKGGFRRREAQYYANRKKKIGQKILKKKSEKSFIFFSVGRGDSSHFPHIYNSTKTGGAGIVCSSVMVVPHMTFMHSE